MYEIYINDTKIVLLPSKNISKPEIEEKDQIQVRYTGRSNHLLSFIDMCEKTDRYRCISIHSIDIDKLISDFKNLFKIVKAAGGVVVNENNEVLFIHRRGSWDLPKGKKEGDEKKRETAKREVEEETGISNVQVDKKIMKTRHTYRNKSGQRCIKLTHWYLMYARKQKLVPQTEEDIEITEWMTLDKFFSEERKVYGNITSVLSKIKTVSK